MAMMIRQWMVNEGFYNLILDSESTLNISGCLQY